MRPLGTAFEWYDFYLYGTLAGILGQHFLSGYNPTADFIVTLMLFAVGFVVRPFGALFFGRLGDMVGRKHIFGHHFDHGFVHVHHWFVADL